MKKNSIDNAKLGLFVLAGVLFLIFSLYMIGRNRNLFGSTITIRASFNNVNGLTTGNNVRFSGIDVGTVSAIEILNDTSILVSMVIDKKAKQFIKKNSVASIGTDGLMGNKLVNINSFPGASEAIDEGSQIESRKPVETDEMLRTLNTTNDNIEVITGNLKGITHKLNNDNSLWTLLADTVIASDIKQAVIEVRGAGENLAALTYETRKIVKEMQQGKGIAGTLLSDTVSSEKLKKAIEEIQHAGNQAAIASNGAKEIIERIKSGKGTAGKFLQDTVLVDDLHQSLINIRESTSRFNENMVAMRHNFLFRRYFKNQEKKSKK